MISVIRPICSSYDDTYCCLLTVFAILILLPLKKIKKMDSSKDETISL